MFLSRHPVPHAQRGFTLMEMAIVMGITGVIIGGIFAAAANVQYRARINRAADDLNITSSNARDYFIGRAAPTGACPPNFATAGVALPKDVFPQDMWDSTGAVMNNQWNMSSATSTAYAGGCGGTPARFTVEFTKLTPDVCSDLVVHNSMPGRETGLVQVNINGALAGAASTAATTTPLPITPVTAATACSDTANTVDWIYTIND